VLRIAPTVRPSVLPWPVRRPNSARANVGHLWRNVSQTFGSLQ
jgi:hypothetical protein